MNVVTRRIRGVRCSPTLLAAMLVLSTWSVAGAEESAGKTVYDAVCAVCHATGVAGAPKVGDQALWSELIGKGIENLEERAINGVQGYSGNMPAKGGNPALTDEEVKAAVA